MVRQDETFGINASQKHAFEIKRSC